MTPTVALSLLWSVFWLPGQMPSPAPPPASKDEQPSDAERIARLQRIIEADQKHLQQLKDQLQDPNNDYHEAESQFRMLDAQLTAVKKEMQRLKEESKAEEFARRQTEADTLDDEWQSARDRFNLAIEERKILQGSVAALRQKIQQYQQALSRLTEETAAEPQDEGAAHADAGSQHSATAKPAAGSSTPRPTQLGLGSTPAEPGPAAEIKRPPSPRLAKARQDAQAKEAAAREAQSTAQSITQRLEALRRNSELEQKLLETARKKAEQAQESLAALDKELNKKLADRAGVEDIARLRQKITDAEQRLTRAHAETSASGDRLRELLAELGNIQAEQAQALHEAERKQTEAERARDKVADLQNPFNPHNLLRWLLDHAPRLLLILTGMMVLRRLVNVSSRRIVQIVARRGSRGSREEGESRAQTLVGVFRHAASLVIVGGGTLMLLDSIGLPIIPLLGGAAVAGLAVAFGAQNLIRDYFSGFMVLLEDQYSIDDWVKIGETSGLVEKITLRVTVLRDTDGAVHFIPHGTITTVSNMSHGWSRALFEIGVAYKEDVDFVMTMLLEMGKELRHDPQYAPLILDDPEMLGLDSFDESAVVLKFFIKTKPLKQWLVKRELLRRIKRKFDELGIEIPYPHRTVYHRTEGEVPARIADKSAGGAMDVAA